MSPRYIAIDYMYMVNYPHSSESVYRLYMVNYPHSSESVYGKNCQRNKLYIPNGGRGAPPPFPVAPMGVRVVVLSLDTRDIRLSALCIKYPLNNKIKLSIFKGGNENLYNFKIFFSFCRHLFFLSNFFKLRIFN